jgi:hypothetical protein
MAQSSGARARPFRQSLAEGCNRLFEPLRAALALSERCERIAEIIQGHAMLILSLRQRTLPPGDRDRHFKREIDPPST